MADRRNSDFAEQESLLNRIRTPEAKKKWDSFRDDPVKIHSRSMQETKWLDIAEKTSKILAYIFTFIVVLGCAMISKGTLLFITSQLSNDTRPYCNEDLDKNKIFQVELPEVEKVSWIWILIFIYWIPELGTFIRSFRICYFKSYTYPSKLEFFVVALTESLPAIGSSIFVFCVLPEIDVIKGAMLTNGLSLVPAIMSSITRDCRRLKSSARLVCDIISLIGQLSALIVWPIIESDKPSLWLIPVSLFLISFGWWENFTSEQSPIKLFQLVGKANKTFENKRYFIYIFVSVWKALLFFTTTLVIYWIKLGSGDFLFDNFYDAFQAHGIKVSEVLPLYDESALEITGGTIITTDYMTVMWVFLINIITSYVCYAFGKFACKIMIQGFSFAFPINLVVPCTISAIIAMCGLYNEDPCAYHGTIPPYLFFKTPPMYLLSNYMSQAQPWIWLLWLLSQCWITIHIWKPTCEKLGSTEKLFVRPVYDAYFIDQSMAMNRRRDDTVDYRVEEDVPEEDDNVTRIFACGTMWHETKEEMMEFLKSIMRLDRDQCARRIVREYFKFKIADYYKLETHIFFDDAFVRLSENDKEPQVNQFVKDLVTAVDDSASEVHEKIIKVRAPKIFITPYGGRLVWTLPGKTKMIAHLKDKKKIRAKKRWSQVMYMYFLLGHRLMDRDDLNSNRKEVIAQNTYILALDGDIDFQPQAVLLLVDLMKKNKSLGAACGRIHPIGSGPMVWYQMFEYAVGHWLQKATEHMIGCVLCSPGCFSLFRGSALMDDNVMKKYTTRSTEALHYVQYDQGEDRWLCTLLLQRGYRVEYSAASDAYTHCPEGFNEFYNQRRRWMPSTTANILDLLMNYKRVVKINDNISFFYILYQIIMMIGTVVGPGTIFLMLIGAFVAAFQMDQWSSFMWNAVPILVYMFVSFTFKKDSIQLFFAGLISAVYGLVMMAVLVGIMLQISNDGFLAPSSLFFFCVAGEMILTGLLHPKELNCLIFGVVYYVTVPSMYMLLVIYSVFNMNNVSWGTREVTVVKKPEENEQSVVTTTNKEKSLLQKMQFLGSKNNDNAGAFEFSLGNIFKCFLCTRKDNYEEMMQIKLISENLEQLVHKVDVLEKLQLIDPNDPDVVNKKLEVVRGATNKEVNNDNQSKSNTTNITSDNEQTAKIIITHEILPEEQQEGYSWTEDEALQSRDVTFLRRKEEHFWNELLEKYLLPIDDTKDKDRIKKNLKDLRDKAVFAFFMINSLFVLVVFLLTLKKDFLHLNWPLDVKYNVSYIDDEEEIRIEMKYLELEPIGLVFLLFFAVLLIVQFVAMLFHRFGTFCQILANTHINISCSDKSAQDLTEDDMLGVDALKLVTKFQMLKDIDDDGEEEISAVPVSRRKTIRNIEQKLNKPEESVGDLTTAFKRRYTKYLNNDGTDRSMNAGRRATINKLEKRRQTVTFPRRESQAASNGRPHIVEPRVQIPTSVGLDNQGFEDIDV